MVVESTAPYHPPAEVRPWVAVWRRKVTDPAAASARVGSRSAAVGGVLVRETSRVVACPADMDARVEEELHCSLTVLMVDDPSAVQVDSPVDNPVAELAHRHDLPIGSMQLHDLNINKMKRGPPAFSKLPKQNDSCKSQTPKQTRTHCKPNH